MGPHGVAVVQLWSRNFKMAHVKSNRFYHFTYGVSKALMTLGIVRVSLFGPNWLNLLEKQD